MSPTRRTSSCSSSSSRSARTARIRSECVCRADLQGPPVRVIMKFRITALIVVALLLGAGPSFAQSKLNVVTTVEDLAAIAREVGGDRITVESIARGYQDPHFVEA